MPERTYSEKEMAALFERAAELQAEHTRRSPHGPGLTLTELEHIAQESGMDPMLIRQAAAEMDGRFASSRLETRSQTSTHVIVERVVPAPLTMDAVEDVVMELKHRYDSDLGKMMGTPDYGKGSLEQIGRSFEWRHTSVSGIETRVLLRPRGNKTQLRISKRVGWASNVAESVLYGTIAAFLAGAITGAVMHSSVIGFGVFALAALLFIPLIYWADGAWRSKKHRELTELADHVAHLLAASQGETQDETRSAEHEAGDPDRDAPPDQEIEKLRQIADMLEDKPEDELDDETVNPSVTKRRFKNM